MRRPFTPLQTPIDIRGEPHLTQACLQARYYRARLIIGLIFGEGEQSENIVTSHLARREAQTPPYGPGQEVHVDLLGAGQYLRGHILERCRLYRYDVCP